MGRFLLIASLALLAAVVVLVLRHGDAPRTAPKAGLVVLPYADGSPSTLATREVGVGSRAPAPVEPAPQAAPDPSAACTVEVALVTAEDDVPLAGRGVFLNVAELGSPWGESRTLEGSTDEQGRCRWEFAGPLELRHVRVSAAESSPGASRWLDGRAAVPGEVQQVELEVEWGAALAGRVVDEAGNPVPGAEVAAWSDQEFRPSRDPERLVVADAAGRFELAHLGRPFEIVARADGRTAVRGLRGELPRGARAEGDLELVLGPEWRVAGRVLGARGEPVAATLSVRAHSTRSSTDGTSVAGVSTFRAAHADAETDADGRFELGPLPRAAENVRLLSDVYGERYPPLPLEPGPWTIRLEDGVVLRGSVVDAQGAVVAGARVGLDGDGMSSRRTRTAEDGSFEFRGLTELESVHLHVAAAGFAPWLREGIELSLEVRPATVVAQLEPGLPLAGRVLDAHGAPVVGVRLELEGEWSYDRHYITSSPATLEHLVDRGQTRAGPGGDFRFEDLYPGEFVVRAYPPGDSQGFAQTRAHAGETEIVLRMDPAEYERVVLAGRVTDALDGSPVTSFAATAMIETSEGSSGTNRDVLDDEGRFRIALPEPTRLQLVVSAPGYFPWSEPMRARGEGEHAYDVRLVRERSLELRLVHPDGSPADAQLSFADATGRPFLVHAGGGLSRWSSVSTEDGVVRGLGLPADVVRMNVNPRKGREVRQHTLDLRVDPGPVLEVVVDAPDAEPARAAPILVGLLVLSAPRTVEIDVEALAASLRESGPLDLPGEAEVLHVALHVEALSADGQTVAVGDVVPGEDGATLTWTDLLSKEETKVVLPQEIGCAFGGPIPATTALLRLRAHGHDTLEVPFDAARGKAGLPQYVVLRR